MYIMFAALIILIIFTSLMTIFTLHEIHRLTREIQRHNQFDSNHKLMLSFPNRFIERLVTQINNLIENKRQADILYKKKDLQQRQAIANISHDLRTPLTSVVGYIQLLKDESLSDDLRRQYIEIVFERAKALQTLITNFFDLSRCQAGEYTVNLKKLLLQNILSEQVACFYKEFESRNIEPEISIDARAPGVIADEDAIRRIYQNLIQNVIKHGSGRAYISLYSDGSKVVTSFVNDSPKLTPEDVEHIFERFFTGDRMRSGRNTGLGLTITKALVEQMDGSIKAELNDGKLCITIVWINLIK